MLTRNNLLAGTAALVALALFGPAGAQTPITTPRGQPRANPDIGEKRRLPPIRKMPATKRSHIGCL